jgi:hypothetical protein
MKVTLYFFSFFIGYFLSACKTSTTRLENTTEEALFVNEYSKKLDRLYQLDTVISLQGIIKRDKSGVHVNGVYLEQDPEIDGFIKIKGVLKRIAYPLAYYSTDESPQGMFSDTSIKHYRLFLEPIDTEIISDQ